MNKNLFRLVFNAARGQVMAVSEAASSHSGGNAAAAEPAKPEIYASNRPLARVDIAQTAIKTIVAAVALLGAPGWLVTARAQVAAPPATTVVVNTAAPTNQQPTVTTTSSGVTQVNIQTAVGGVSRNRYTQFDVGSSGLILNNSAANSNTQLGGWVQGNTNLASGSAGIILNEISSTNPSQLRGYIEVAGQRAEVVIANPAGISVNGGGFINASGATLTTGTPQFNGNSLTGYQVYGGAIRVTGTGLDTASTGITTLQARQIILQGAVHAQDLRVTADNAGGTANAVAIDVAAIGGMYANKITIIANGQGAGVNNAGSLQANSGSFTLSADGSLTNTGTLNSTATTRINAETVNNSTGGAIYGNSVAIAATTLNNAAASSTDTAPVIAARDSAGRVDIGVQTLNNQEGALIYSAGALAIGRSLDANGQATGRATTVTNNSATIEAAGNVAITTQTLANTHTSLNYRVEVDPTTPATTGSEGCGDDCSHSWTDTYYRAVAIAGPNGAAVIRSGADIALDASTSATNSSSQILAAGTLGVTGVALSSQGIDLTSQVATHRDHHVAQGYMQNGIDCNAFGFDCKSEHRIRHSYSTDLIARNQTIGPAVSEQRSTTASSTAIPNSALFSASNNNRYLVETNPAFTNKQIWLSSDYMLSALSVDPDTVQKRMGDGFYEQRLINEQIAQLTGYRRLANYTSDEQQYQALMGAGVTFALAHQLRPGIALTAEQVASLTSDIVWLETREVTVPGVNGQPATVQKVLVPQVYAVARAGDLAANGALLSGNVVNLTTTGDITNSHANIQGRELVTLNAANVRNLAGRIEGKEIRLTATQDIENIGGAVIAQTSLSATAGRDIVVQTTTLDSTSATSGGSLKTRSTDISRVAGLYVTGDAGVLLASAGRDVDLLGALLQSQGSTTVNAGRNVNLATVTTRASMDATMDADNYNRSSRSAEVGTTLQSAGNTTLTAGQDFKARAADVQAAGDLAVNAGNDVVIESGVATSSVASSRKTNNSGFLSSSTRTERSSSSNTQAVASNFGGSNVTVTSGQDIGVKASNLNASQDLALRAGRDVTIASGQATRANSSYSAMTESGFSASSMGAISVGTSEQSQDNTTRSTTQVASTVSGANVSITSGRDATVKASNVLADQDITVSAARNIDILAAANTQTSTQRSTSSSTTIGLVGDVLGRQTFYGQTDASQNGNNTSVQQSTSALSANGGNLTLKAGNGATGNITTQGAELLADKTITLTAAAVDLQAITDSQTSASQSKTSSLTIGSALSGAVGSLVTAIGTNVDLSQNTQNERLKSAAALKAGYDAYKLAAQLEAAAKAAKAAEAAGSAGAKAAGPAIGISVSIASSSSEQNSNALDTRVRGSNLQAKDIVITATQGDISATAAKLQAETIALDAAQNVKLQAGVNTTQNTSSNSSNNAGVGVSFGVGDQNGFSIQLSAAQAQGRSNGTETTYDNTQLTASNTLSIKSGADTTLKGAQLAADKVTMDVGGKLAIETLQDTSTFTSEQSTSGFNLSLCIPPICYGTTVTGSINQSAQDLDHNYQSAVGQSGIAAGAGGFDIKVAGNTDLKGAAITSTAAPQDNKLQTQSLTSSDLDNRQNTNSSSSSLSLGYSGGDVVSTLAQNVTSNLLSNLGSGAGMPENGSQSGKTLSVISAGNITITGTGDKTTDENSATQVASLTSRDATTANGALTNNLTLQQAQALQAKQKEAQENLQAANLAGAAMDGMIGDVAQNKGWAEGSTQKILLHGLSGLIQANLGGTNALSGFVSGAVNEKLLSSMSDYLESKGIPRTINGQNNPEYAELMKTGSALIGVSTAAVLGGSNLDLAAGGNIAKNATEFNWLKHEDSTKRDALKNRQDNGEKLTDQEQKELAGLELLDRLNNQTLLNACVNLTAVACQAQLDRDPAAKAYGIDHKNLILWGNVLSHFKENSGNAISPLAKELEKFEIKPLVDLKGQITGWAVEVGSGTDATSLRSLLGAGVYVGTEILLPTNAIEVLPLAGMGMKILVREGERILVDAAGKRLATLENDAAIARARIENGATADMASFGSSAQRDFVPGSTHRAENINTGQVTDRDGLPRIDGSKAESDKQIAAMSGTGSATRFSTARPAWMENTVVTDRVVVQPETIRVVIDQNQFDAMSRVGADPVKSLGSWGTKEPVNSMVDVRNNLAISSEFKSTNAGKLYVVEVKVSPGAGLRDGTVGPMWDDIAKVKLPGGSQQVQFMENTPFTRPDLYKVDLTTAKELK